MSNKEKNVTAREKKEPASVLEMIRRRTGLLVGIVGLALIIFILESLLSSGNSIFGNDEYTTVGSINGRKIDRNDFAMKVEQQINMVKQQRQTNDIDEQTRGQVMEYVWNQYMNEMVVKPEMEKIGIFVGDDELYDRVVVNPAPVILGRLVDPNTGKTYEQLAGPDGNLDPNKWRGFVQNASGDQEAFVKDMEEKVKMSRLTEKYSSLIRKGLYATSAEVKESYKVATGKFNFEYAMKRYEELSDSAAKITDADIQAYYNDHKHEFYNPVTVRRIEYVSYNVNPSPEDIAAIEADAKRAAEEWKGKNVSEDSSYMAQESENGNITIESFTRKTMIVRDSTVYTAAPGTVFGPYNEGAYFKIYKLQGVMDVADSAKVRHILVGLSDPQTQKPKRSKPQARREADSLLALIKDKKVTFDTLVKTFSDDFGSRDKGGDYGWYDEAERFVDPFKYAGLLGKKGDISVVETVFGYHIIEVVDVAPSRHTSYKIAQIFKPIAPSDDTYRMVMTEANEFGGAHNTGELFDKGVKEKKLSIRVADNIKEGDREIPPAIQQAKEMVRWIYSAKKGDVGVFSFNDKHVVAKLASIKNKGTLPLEEVKDEVAARARQEKKADMMVNEFKSKAGSSNNLQEIAAKLNIAYKKLDSLPASRHVIDGFHDDVMMGTLHGIKEGQLSRVTRGEAGVFIVKLNKTINGPPLENIRLQQLELENEFLGRADYEAMNVLKERANIEDHRSRLD